MKKKLKNGGVPDFSIAALESYQSIFGGPEVPQGESPASAWENAGVGSYIQREVFVGKFGFVIPITEVLDAIASLVGRNSVLEVGSGSAYLASRLAARGIDIRCSDNNPVAEGENFYNFECSHMPVERLSGGEAVASAPETIILLTWPSYESDFGYEVARALRPRDVLIYNGEGPGGCCATDAFFDELSKLEYLPTESDALNDNHVQWHGVHDYWQVFRKQS